MFPTRWQNKPTFDSHREIESSHISKTQDNTNEASDKLGKDSKSKKL